MNIKTLVLVCLYIQFIKAENVDGTKFKIALPVPKPLDCKCVPYNQCKTTEKKFDKPNDSMSLETYKKR